MPLKDTIVNDTRTRGVSRVSGGRAQVKGQNTWTGPGYQGRYQKDRPTAARCAAQNRSNTCQRRRTKQTRKSGSKARTRKACSKVR